MTDIHRDLKRTKIVATIGPASASVETLTEMVKSGMNVVRLNFSHGDHKDHMQVIENIRTVNENLGANTAILADLQGPKLRIGEMKDGSAVLEGGSTIEIVTKSIKGTAKRIGTNYVNFAKDVKRGEKVLLDDGKIHLEVLESDKKDSVKCKVLYGGVLSSKKGINLPNTRISLPCLTEKDLIDLDFALEHNVDWIGLSFVRSSSDINELQTIIAEQKKHAMVVAKIEKPEALDDIDGIIEATNAIMVARGDLGVEVPMQTVPIIQKMLINKSIAAGKPVIVATQMMESMITNITPTRAEVNDVANAVLDGADAVMLSAETSVGSYPVEVIRAMNKIIEEMEAHDNMYYRESPPGASDLDRFVSDSICYNACRLAKRTSATAIITMTFSGYTGFKISSQRPKAKTYVFTGNKKILTLMNLVWGVTAFYYDKMVSTDHTIADIRYNLKRKGFIEEGDFIVNIASMPISEQGMSNMLKLSKA